MELLKELLPYAISLLALYIAFRKNNRDEQTSAIEALQVQQELMEKSLTEEKTKNHLITEILQGRDESTQKFQKDGHKAFAQIYEIHQKVVVGKS